MLARNRGQMMMQIGIMILLWTRSSVAGSVSMDTEDAPALHPNELIDITVWNFPKRMFSMVKT